MLDMIKVEARWYEQKRKDKKMVSLHGASLGRYDARR